MDASAAAVGEALGDEDFGELLLRESRNTGFCVPFRSIRSSKEGPTAVARGCLEVARRLEEEMRPGRAT